jgi:hypothetical protein
MLAHLSAQVSYCSFLDMLYSVSNAHSSERKSAQMSKPLTSSAAARSVHNACRGSYLRWPGNEGEGAGDITEV